MVSSSRARSAASVMVSSETVKLAYRPMAIVDICKPVGISRSSYYHKRSEKPSARALKYAALVATIRAVFTKTRKRYGSPRIMRALRKRGVRVGKKRVARLMRQNSASAKLQSARIPALFAVNKGEVVPWCSLNPVPRESSARAIVLRRRRRESSYQCRLRCPIR